VCTVKPKQPAALPELQLQPPPVHQADSLSRDTFRELSSGVPQHLVSVLASVHWTLLSASSTVTSEVSLPAEQEEPAPSHSKSERPHSQIHAVRHQGGM
jgi:hypothetical protein